MKSALLSVFFTFSNISLYKPIINNYIKRLATPLN